MKALKRIKLSIALPGILLFFAFGSVAQSKIGIQIPFVESHFDFVIKIPDLKFGDKHFLSQSLFFSMETEASDFLGPPLLHDVFTTCSSTNAFTPASMPFFCRLELQIEQSASFPVKIRLGDVNYVDRLESKKDWELGN